MKKLLALIFFFLFGTFFQVGAQPSQWQGDIIPGVRQIIIEYGDQLNLTDEQKSELISQSLKQRRNMQRYRMRNNRQRIHLRRERIRDQNERGEDKEQRKNRIQPENRIQKLYNVLTDEQEETLKSLLISRAEKAHEFRTLRNDILINRAGLEGDKATQVTTILNRQSETRKDVSVRRIQNPGENREVMHEALQSMHKEHQEIKNILTATEYEKLQSAISPRLFHYQTLARRPVMFKR